MCIDFSLCLSCTVWIDLTTYTSLSCTTWLELMSQLYKMDRPYKPQLYKLDRPYVSTVQNR